MVFLFITLNRETSYVFPRIGHKCSDLAMQICLSLIRKSSRCNFPRPPIMAKCCASDFRGFFYWKLLSIAGRLAKYAPRAAQKKSKDLYPRRPYVETNFTPNQTPPKYPTQHLRLHSWDSWIYLQFLIETNFQYIFRTSQRSIISCNINIQNAWVSASCMLFAHAYK